jgi:NADH-quinone oxidoreductase subunit C
MLTTGQKKLLVELKEKIKQTAPETQIKEGGYQSTGCHLEIRLEGIDLRPLASTMKDKGFYLETMTALDYIDHFEVVYIFYTYNDESFRLLTRMQVDREAVPFSISAIYPAAIWLEREVYDFFGIRFQEHPDLKRIINPDDVEYFPLLKNFGKTKFTAEIDDILC